jgi:hypothetical protein
MKASLVAYDFRELYKKLKLIYIYRYRYIYIYIYIANRYRYMSEAVQKG